MTTPLSFPKKKSIVVLFLLLVTILTTLNPIYPNEQFLQHIGTFIISLVLLIDLKKNKLQLGAFICVSLFILIHIIGARWIYSFVPYQDWLNNIFGWNLDSSRNHFDRFAHFSFGILIFPYFYNLFSLLKIRKKIKVLIAWALVQSFSVFYETFEWMLTLLLSGDTADNYNGQQGDLWDAQKDMALAMLGSTLIGAYFLLFNKKNN